MNISQRNSMFNTEKLCEHNLVLDFCEGQILKYETSGAANIIRQPGEMDHFTIEAIMAPTTADVDNRWREYSWVSNTGYPWLIRGDTNFNCIASSMYDSGSPVLNCSIKNRIAPFHKDVVQMKCFKYSGEYRLGTGIQSYQVWAKGVCSDDGSLYPFEFYPGRTYASIIGDTHNHVANQINGNYGLIRMRVFDIPISDKEFKTDLKILKKLYNPIVV